MEGFFPGPAGSAILASHIPKTTDPATATGHTCFPKAADRPSGLVTSPPAQAALQYGQSADTRYEMSRHDAAVVLELAAGWNPTY